MKIRSKIKNLIFDATKRAKVSTYVYEVNNHTGWGNSIEFERREIKKGQFKMSAHGHLWRLPKNGDIFRSKMKSGKVGDFKVINVRYPGDPSDMWFCDLNFAGYVNEAEFRK